MAGLDGNNPKLSRDEPPPGPAAVYVLSATYASPANEPFALAADLPAPGQASAFSVADKSAYLGALRQATASMRDQINRELTARMEDDKAREAVAAPPGGAGKPVVDEAREEENYGEEVMDEDE